jgi:U3 small nucleolar RNA-associated protein 14
MCKEWTGVVFLDKWWPIVQKAKDPLEDPLYVGETVTGHWGLIRVRKKKKRRRNKFHVTALVYRHRHKNTDKLVNIISEQNNKIRHQWLDSTLTFSFRTMDIKKSTANYCQLQMSTDKYISHFTAMPLSVCLSLSIMRATIAWKVQ